MRGTADPGFLVMAGANASSAGALTAAWDSGASCPGTGAVNVPPTIAGRKLTIVLSGMIAADHGQGGATWAVLQYLLGLKQLGHTVYFVEPVDPSRLQPAGVPLRHSTNAAYFRQVVEQFGLRQEAALLQAGTQQTVGLPYERLCAVARQADLLLNISGILEDDALTGDIPARIYLDLDPAFTQLWHTTQGIDMRFANHSHHVTVGLAIGRPESVTPTGGVHWLTTLQPVVLEYWPRAERVTRDALTTVANWRGYGSIEHDGVFYGQKAHSLRRFMELPRLVDEDFVLALSIHPDECADLTALAANGWQLVDPRQVTHTPTSYQEFIRNSWAEFGIAKSGYVVSGCGWFSDRSACYLASGRPVIAQETGFSRYLPTGNGLFAFAGVDDVLASLEALRGDYEAHARSARSLAEEFFDSRKVLADLLRRLDLVP